MTDFAYARDGKAAHAVLAGVAFGFAHLGYSAHGIAAAAGTMVPTALVGMLCVCVGYLLGRRAFHPALLPIF